MKDLYEALAEAHELDERKMETKHPQKRVHESQSGSNQVVTPNKVHEIIDSFKNELPYGFLTVSENAVRYMTEEMDGVYYATISDLVKGLRADPELLETVAEDPFELFDCFPKKVYLHHAFEIETFVEDVKRLNVEYFGTEMVDDVDKKFEEASDSTLDLFDESLTEDKEMSVAVKSGISTAISKAKERIQPCMNHLESSLVEYFDKYKDELESDEAAKVKDQLDNFLTYINVSIIDKINKFKNQLK